MDIFKELYLYLFLIMAGNSFGNIFRLTSYGESHGPAIGGILDGCPSGINIDIEKIQHDLDRRKPGQSAIVTQRKEADDISFLSGIFEGKTTGTPIGFIIKNSNQKSKDYNHIKESYRPSHADFVYDKKYGNRDYRGGGRSSARETASRVVAGAIAKQFLSSIRFTAYVKSVGSIELNKPYQELDLNNIESNPVRCPDKEIASKMEAYIKDIKKEGNTIGGVIRCIIQNVPIGLGEPVFDKLHAQLGKAIRRNSTDLDDIFHAHIGGADNFARALITADNILTSSNYKELFNLRYESFNSGKGKEFEQGKLNLNDLYKLALSSGKLKLKSGKQELFENIINQFI